MATPKQIAANRCNALKSTGPSSEEGKKQSRRNALKHGLAGSGLVLPLEERSAVEERIAEWHSSLKPFDNYETWLLEVAAVESIRVDRCRIQERVLREDQICRSLESWDDDQRQLAEELAAKLAKDSSVVAKLRKTVPGASLVLDRWHALLRALENGGWSEAQEDLAHDLLGTSMALREGVASPLNPGPHGNVLEHRLELVREQVEQLRRLLTDVLPARDAAKRDLIQAGVPDLEDRALLRLHRYESRCFRRLMWATSQMRSKHKGVTLLPEHATEANPPKPPRESEPPIYRRPLLQHSVDKRAAKYVAERMREADANKTQETVDPGSSKHRPNLPLTKDRLSRRVCKPAKSMG